MKLLLLVIGSALLSACSLVGFVIKESVVESTSHFGFRHATLTIEIPDGFYASYKAYYRSPIPEECTTDGSHPRAGKIKSEEVDAKNHPQTVEFKVPLSYQIGSCTMNLSTLQSFIGPTDKEGHVSVTSLEVVHSTESVKHQHATEEVIRRLCAPTFNIYPAHTDLKKLHKTLTCNTVNEQWILPESNTDETGDAPVISLNALKYTSIRYIYRLTTKERPFYPQNWRKFESGWKPCGSQWKWLGEGACAYRDPQFTNFIMPDGRRCSIYPNCTD